LTGAAAKRGSRLGCLATLAILIGPRVGWCTAAAPTPLLRVVDDRGRAVEEQIEVCFQVELRTDCRQVAPGEEVHSPAAFNSVRIEGPGHGPRSWRRDELKAEADGAWRVAVARKAWLRVVRAEESVRRQSLTITLYSPDSPAFREPFFRTTLAPGAALARVPAGVFVASLAMTSNAPELHRLTARPGGQAQLSYRPRRGWSLLVRCRSSGAKLVGGVAIVVSETVGFGHPERTLARADSRRDGLVLVSGLEAAIASLAARHPDFLAAEARGLTASPGTFAFRDLALGVGGRLRAHVNVHGRPLPGAECHLDALDLNAADRNRPYRELWAGKVDARGVCVTSRQGQGVYQLRVSVPQDKSQISRWLSVDEGQDTDVDVALAPTRVAGEVRRGKAPAAGYLVQAMRVPAGQPKGARGEVSAEATSDDAGKFDLTLWEPGWYFLSLRSPSGVRAAGRKELTAAGDDEQRVDFDLQSDSLRGQVVDEAGRPVPEAWVGVRWQGLFAVTSDGQGNFEVDVEGEGSATLNARKVGYRASEELSVVVTSGSPLAPVTLVLKATSTLRGRVVSAAGAPVANAVVAIVDSTTEVGPLQYRTASSEADGSFELEVPPGPRRVFASGPGCPLSAFDLPPAGDTAAGGGEPAPMATLPCAEVPAALEVTLVDASGQPIPHSGLILRRQGVIVPQQVLAAHLQRLGLSAETDGAGHLVLAGLTPGDYELFLNRVTGEGLIASGSRKGYLTAVALPPSGTTELQLTLPQAP
jgi:hypothetical protein